MWIDVTWGAGGSTSDTTFDICHEALKYRGVDVMMHLTCSNMPVEKLTGALDKCKEAGICNILALRGDAPEGSDEWSAVEGGFMHAIDLVKYIRANYGNFFSIGVAAYPEGHLEAESPEKDLQYLKEKVDAGADVIITQLYYDNEQFFNFEKKCRDIGINIPIVPGIMPIQSYSGFRKMTGFCKTVVPACIEEDLEPIKDDERRVKDLGVEYGIKMCRELLENGVPGLHFYTLNLETTVCRILEGLQLVTDWHATRELPWLRMKHKDRTQESVRPIFWGNRPSSYVQRTDTWDDFPNGRYGNKDSPAFGECVFVSYAKESLAKVRSDRREMWNAPETLDDVANVFIKFIKNDIKKLPWCCDSPSKETNFVFKQLVKLNSIGCFTTNSQPRMNAALSTDPIVGWGPSGGFVYQKAYVEFFLEKDRLVELMNLINRERLKMWTIQAVNNNGSWVANVDGLKNTNAVTWGVFPNSEIIQLTVVDTQSFLAWKTEAFELWNDWIELYEENSKPHALLSDIRDNYYLVCIVDNDFCSGDMFTQLVTMMEDSWGGRRISRCPSPSSMTH